MPGMINIVVLHVCAGIGTRRDRDNLSDGDRFASGWLLSKSSPKRMEMAG